MNIVEIEPLYNGAHRNQSGADICPDGWAIIQDELDVPDSFPFVRLTVEQGIVIGMEPLPVPEPEPVPEPIDMAQRITEMEDAIIELAGIIGGD